jgi:putative chitinase
MNIGSNGAANITSGGDISIGATGNLYENADNIHMNGPSGGIAATAATPELPIPLEIFSLPNRKPSSGWNNKNFYKADDIKSILQRVPTHEPWPHHESIDPEQFTSDNTDIVVTPPPLSETSNNPTAQVTTSTAAPVNTKPVSPPISKNAKGTEAYLQSVLIASGITNPIKLASWMAQCKVESGGFIYTKEIWGPTTAQRGYEGRKDLGNNQPGDGIRFLGRGFIQLTGRVTYKSMTSYFNGPDFTQQPEIVEGIEWASKSVLFFFNVFKPKGFKNYIMTQKYTDTVEFWADCKSVTGMVNGGLNHFAERQAAYNFYLNKFQTQGINPDTTAVKGGPGSQLAQKSGDPVKRS